MRKIVYVLGLIGMFTSCEIDSNEVLYQSDDYTVGKDFVHQGEFEAEAISDIEIRSDYQVLSKVGIDTSMTWKLKRDISKFPQFSSDSRLLNALYNMALEESENLVTSDGYFDTGAKWGGVWTRDLSYASMLSLSVTHPEVVKKGLLKKVDDNRIIQDTGTGGAWPVSTDRMIWAPAAWHLYKITGDREWLNQIYIIIKNSLDDDIKVAFTKDGLTKGESSFIDWREQSYPRWMQPVDIYNSENLGTIAVHYRALMVLSEISHLLGEDAGEYEVLARNIKKALNDQFWIESKGYYGNFLYGRNYLSLSPKAEALGASHMVRFGIASDERAKKMIESFPVVKWGTPVFYPQIPNIHPYHNNGIWPFVQGFWNLAAKKVHNEKAVEFGMASLFRSAGLFLTNYENYVAETGDWEQTDVEAMNSHNMLWSVAAQLSNYYKILFGIEYNANSISFDPLIPSAYGGNLELKNYKYRNSILNIKISGFGNKIASFRIDGEEQDPYVDATLEGEHNIEIVMNGQLNRDSKINLVENKFSPETPVLKVEGDILKWEATENAISYQIYRNGVLKIQTDDTQYNRLVDGAFESYQVKAIDKIGNESFLSEPVEFENSFSVTIPVGKFEKTSAKDVESLVLTQIENNQIYTEFNVLKEGKYFVTFEYANGSGPINTENKCALRSLYLNDEYIAAVVMPQRGEDNWSEFGWSNVIEVNLEKGNNRIKLQYDDFNQNMNREINKALLKSAKIVLAE